MFRFIIKNKPKFSSKWTTKKQLTTCTQFWLKRKNLLK